MQISKSLPWPKGALSLLLMICPFFLWGTAMVAMKGTTPHTEPYFLAGFRLLPAGILILLATVYWQLPQPQTWRAWAWIGLFGLVDGTLFQGFLTNGLMRTKAGLGSVMIDSQPLAVALLSAWLFRESIGLWGAIGLALGVLGISCIGIPEELWVTLLDPEQSWQWSRLLAHGEWLMLLAALSMAVGTVLVPYVTKVVDPVVATGWHMVIGSLPLFAWSWWTEDTPWQLLTPVDWSALAYSTVFGSALAYGLFFYFASRGNLTSLSALTFLTPIFALIFGRLFLQEDLSLLQFAGVGVTLVSVLLINQREAIDRWLAPAAQLASDPESLTDAVPNETPEDVVVSVDGTAPDSAPQTLRERRIV
jgi:drug/metabolite transporter (DMT)-like permease